MVSKLGPQEGDWVTLVEPHSKDKAIIKEDEGSILPFSLWRTQIMPIHGKQIWVHQVFWHFDVELFTFETMSILLLRNHPDSGIVS